MLRLYYFIIFLLLYFGLYAESVTDVKNISEEQIKEQQEYITQSWKEIESFDLKNLEKEQNKIQLLPEMKVSIDLDKLNENNTLKVKKMEHYSWNNIEQITTKNKENMTRILIFISFSMPNKVIQALIDEAVMVDGELVLKGLFEDDFSKTIAKLQELVDENDLSRIIIDPTLFSRFNIQQVPTFILLNDILPECIEDNCPLPNEYFQLQGVVSLYYFLTKIARHTQKKEIKILINDLLREYRG